MHKNISMGLKIRNLRKTFSIVLHRVHKELILVALLCIIILHLFEHVVPRGKLRDISCVYKATIERYYENRQYWVTSNLGSILFKNQDIPYNQLDRNFTVLVWKHPYWSKAYLKDPLNSMCSVDNCIFTKDASLINTVDAVVVATYKAELPWVNIRNTSQRWVFLSNESPINTFSGSKKTINITRQIQSMANIFNWSMTYRSDSDVPTPYGRTVPLPEYLINRMSSQPIKQIVPYWENKQRDVLVVALISHCNVPERMNYIYELKKYIKVDLFGKCAETSKMREGCPGSSHQDCWRLKNYIFYLAFENSRCRQYLTEKVFYNAYTKGAIPIVMGAPVSDYDKLLPPHSFLHVNSFDSPKDLAMEIIQISNNEAHLELYHKWRYYFGIVNEHGFRGSKSYDLCRLCEALNYNDNETKIYDLDTLKLYLDPKFLCTVSVNPPFYIRMATTTNKYKPPRLACQKRVKI